MTIPKHWIISASVAIPGAVLFRAVDSQWIQIESLFLYYTLTVLGLTMALTGILIFIFMLHYSQLEKAKK